MQPMVDPMMAAALTSAVFQLSLLVVGVWAVRAARTERARLEVRLESFERHRGRRAATDRRLYEASASLANVRESERSLYLD
ncbi:MAG: hypothetical protein ACRD21_01720 [Vicinamibacteria bacterium]